jgi:hypothetical protein
MTVIIRHPLTKLYHRKDGSWVDDVNMAQRFRDVPAAIKFCFVKDFDAYQVLLVVKQRESDPKKTLMVEKRPGEPFHATLSRTHLFSQPKIKKGTSSNSWR